MSKSKDKRIKKLGKKRIWPSILGLFMILFCFIVIFVSIIGLLISDILKTKIVEGTPTILDISSILKQSDSDELTDETISSLKLYVELESDIKCIAIFGENGEHIWSSDNRFPELDKDMDFSIYDDVGVYSDLSEDNYLPFNGNNFTISKEFLDKLENGKNEEITSSISLFELPLMQMNFWYEVPLDIGSVCILKTIKLYNYDFIALEVCSTLVAALILIFTIYYLVTFIALFSRMLKTQKVLYTDMVTGAPNELFYEKNGIRLLKRSAWFNRRYAVVHLRLRKYRSYCTCFGVREGESLLEKCYSVLKKHIHSNELIAHFEDAKFGLLLLYENEEQLIKRIEELETTVNNLIPSLKLYFAVGVYLVQKGDTDIIQLYNNALLACDKLGNESENKLAFYDIELNKQRIWERKVEDDLDRALANKEFKVYLQPKIRTSEEVLAGAEALVRWIHPEDGFIPPNKFIPILEKNGFITKLDDYMLEEVASLQSKWLQEGHQIVPISVNVSRVHFTRDDLAEHITSIIDRHQVPHSAIELELTESAFFDDKELLLNTVDKLRASGFSVSMDDFGAGYSSLNSLKEMHIDILKIDADFFRGADAGERGKLIVSEVISLAKKLNLTIVAEGIENREQVDFLTSQECDMIQGYYFAKPMPTEEFAEKYHK